MTRERNAKVGGDHGPTIDKRKAIIVAVLAIALTGAAITGLGQIAHVGRLERGLSHASKAWLIPCLIGQLLAYLGYLLAYHDAARADGGPRFGYRTTARIVAFGAGASVLGASIGGLAVDYWALRRSGTKTRVASRRVLAVGTIEWTVLSLYALAAAALSLITGAHVPRVMALAWLCAVPACIAAAVWCTSPRRVSRFTEPPAQKHPHGGRVASALAAIAFKLRTGLHDAIAGVVFVRHLLSHPLRYLGGTVGYPIYWAGDMLTLYSAVRCFGGHISLIALVVAYATSFVVSALPLPAGGAGGIEATMSLTLHAVGIALPSAVLATLLYRIITFWLPVVPALALLPSIRRLHAKLPDAPHSSRDADEGASFRPSADRAA